MDEATKFTNFKKNFNKRYLPKEVFSFHENLINQAGPRPTDDFNEVWKQVL